MMSVADIDSMLAVAKTLAGVPTWVEDERGTVARIVVPVATGGVVAGLTFRAGAVLHARVQTGSCVLVCDGRPVQRLSFRPDHAHVNPFGKGVPKRLRGLRLPPGVSRLHAWSVNRDWPRSPADNVAVAEPLNPEPASFEDALEFFLRLCNIDGEIPLPPWEPPLL